MSRKLHPILLAVALASCADGPRSNGNPCGDAACEDAPAPDAGDAAGDADEGDLGDPGDAADDASADGPPDVARDVAPDTAADVAPDVAGDVAPDVREDATLDVALDASVDAAPDAAPDIAVDVRDSAVDSPDAAADVRDAAVDVRDAAADVGVDAPDVRDAASDVATDVRPDAAPADVPATGGCVSGAVGTHVARFRWLGSGPSSTAYVSYEANTLPDRSRWRATANSRSIGYRPVFTDTFLGEGGLELSGTVFIDVELSTAGLGRVSNVTLAVYGRSFNTTASGSFAWRTFAGTGAAPSGLVANSAPYRWYRADATAAFAPGDSGVLLRVTPGPPSGALIVSRVEVCFDAR